jgi:hypothetical protein
MMFVCSMRMCDLNMQLPDGEECKNELSFDIQVTVPVIAFELVQLPDVSYVVRARIVAIAD